MWHHGAAVSPSGFENAELNIASHANYHNPRFTSVSATESVLELLPLNVSLTQTTQTLSPS